MIAADCSNWSRVPTAADIAALKGLGVTRMIVGTSFSQRQPDGSYVYIADQQMAAFEAAGFEVQEYQFIGKHYPSTRPVWLDVELAETADDVRKTLLLLAIWNQMPIGIYTRRGIWDLIDVDLVSEFPGLKLWDANYGPLPRTFIPYGGWTKADMTQWHDTMDIGTGFNIDLNEYEEAHMPTPEYDELKQADKDIETAIAAVRDILDGRVARLETQRAALQTGVTFLIDVVNNVVPRLKALEDK